MCGCLKDSDCKSNYKCDTTYKVCEATETCTNSKCKAMTDDYLGNVCVDGYGGEKMCGCNGNSDCKSGYKCNSTMLMCYQTSSSCDASACADMDNYYGSACVDNDEGGKMCGCTKNTECKDGYTCNTSTKTCEVKCTATKCKSMTGNDYMGNVCVDGYNGEKMCGCTKDTDCKSGYKCNSTMMMCYQTSSSCTTSECKAATGIQYFGNVCIDDGLGGKMCGCTKNTDCKSGYTCDDDTCVNTSGSCTNNYECAPGYVCDNGTCVKNSCTNNDDCSPGYICDNGTCVESAGSNPIKIKFASNSCDAFLKDKATVGVKACESSDSKNYTITFDNGVVMIIKANTPVNGFVALKNENKSYIEISNMKALSTIDFSMSVGIKGEGVNKSPLLITDGNGNKQQIFGDTSVNQGAQVNRRYKLTGSAQKITMEHDPDSETDYNIGIHSFSITAP